MGRALAAGRVPGLPSRRQRFSIVTEPRTIDEFRASFPLQREHEAEFGEIDMNQHVNNVRYAVWTETLRGIFFADVIQAEINGPTGIVMAKHELHYEGMVRYRERVAIGGRVSRWGTKSFDFTCEVWSLATGARVFRGIATLVAFDYEANASIAIPAVWRERVAAHAGASSV